MKKAIFLFLFLLILTLVLKPTVKANTDKASWWEVQSIDTVKYSRDLSREKLNSKSFPAVIDAQINQIAHTGATHVALGTPYDEEFLPILELWVKTARKYDLNVWFRGNFSGWEGWFGYKSITREEHLSKTKEFILSNGHLFADGDVFTSCPECENGGPGDPRRTGDVEGHRNFLIQEYQITSDSFRKIGKNVKSNYISMNGDVAKLIYDPKTTNALGGVVVIDHYVATPEQLARDVKELARISNGKVVLGELGVPIPDIHGRMNEKMQRDWLERAFQELIDLPELIGINYWVNMGGTAALWSEGGAAREAVEVISYYYQPKTLKVRVIDELDNPLQLAKVSIGIKEAYTDQAGYAETPYYTEESLVDISAPGYVGEETEISSLKYINEITLEKNNPGLIFRIFRFLHRLFN